MTNVKWLTEITVVTEPFAGYQEVDGVSLPAATRTRRGAR